MSIPTSLCVSSLHATLCRRVCKISKHTHTQIISLSANILAFIYAYLIIYVPIYALYEYTRKIVKHTRNEDLCVFFKAQKHTQCSRICTRNVPKSRSAAAICSDEKWRIEAKYAASRRHTYILCANAFRAAAI